MAEHRGHSWVQPCREYLFPDGETVKGLCVITSEEAVTLLRHYVEIEMAKPDVVHVPMTYGFGGPVVGEATCTETDQGIMIQDTVTDPLVRAYMAGELSVSIDESRNG